MPSVQMIFFFRRNIFSLNNFKENKISRQMTTTRRKRRRQVLKLKKEKKSYTHKEQVRIPDHTMQLLGTARLKSRFSKRRHGWMDGHKDGQTLL